MITEKELDSITNADRKTYLNNITKKLDKARKYLAINAAAIDPETDMHHDITAMQQLFFFDLLRETGQTMLDARNAKVKNLLGKKYWDFNPLRCSGPRHIPLSQDFQFRVRDYAYYMNMQQSPDSYLFESLRGEGQPITGAESLDTFERLSIIIGQHIRIDDPHEEWALRMLQKEKITNLAKQLGYHNIEALRVKIDAPIAEQKERPELYE